jgi:porin
VDTEFLFSQYFSFFNSSDWPTNPAVNIPSGGAAYPLSTPGLRLKVEPKSGTTVLISVLNGDPAGPGPEDPELRNRYGLNLRLNDPPFLIAEIQQSYNQARDAIGPAGGVRFGGWHHFGGFDDQRFASNGVSLASPLSSRVARRFRGNTGVYAVVDQQLYRPPGADANTGVLSFARFSASPGDRNFSDWYLDGGLIFNGMLKSRPSDAFVASFLYTHISPRISALDADTAFFSGQPTVRRNYELSLEFNYSVFLKPGWTVQPNVAVVFNPSGAPVNPDPQHPSERLRNAVLIGARSVWKY